MIAKKNEDNYLLYLFVGAIVYTIGYEIVHPQYKSFGHFVGMMGVCCSFYFYTRCCLDYLFDTDRTIQVILKIFIFYAFVVIFRGLLNGINSGTLIDILTQKRGVLGYLTPLVLLYFVKFSDIRLIFRVCYIACYISIIFCVLNFREIFLTSHTDVLVGSWEDIFEAGVNNGQIPGYFVLPSSLIILSYKFMPKKYLNVSLVAFILSLGAAISYGRRSYVAFHLIILLFFLVHYFTSHRIQAWQRFLLLTTLLSLGLVIFFLFSELSIFDVFLSRLGEDTRGGVEDEFFRSFRDKEVDWFWGRGIFGTYYSWSVSGKAGSFYRTVIETGYLQFILNGGIIVLVLYLFILLKASFLGFFRTKNTLTKAFALYLFANVLFLQSGNSLEFTLKGVFIWLIVTICNSKKWRNSIEDNNLLILKNMK